eukprot:6461748-Amphidinium_carterae.1
MTHRDNNAPLAFTMESVTTQKDFSIDVSKRFLILGEKEMKKQLGSQKLSQKQMHGVPQLRIMNEDGQWEQVFVFPHPDHPWREACISFKQGVVQSGHVLDCSKHAWKGQGDAMYQKSVAASTSEANMQAFFGKDGGMTTLEDFTTKALKTKEEAAQNPSHDQSLVKDSDDEAPLVGAAACRNSSIVPDEGKKGKAGSKDASKAKKPSQQPPSIQ